MPSRDTSFRRLTKLDDQKAAAASALLRCRLLDDARSRPVMGTFTGTLGCPLRERLLSRMMWTFAADHRRRHPRLPRSLRGLRRLILFAEGGRRTHGHDDRCASYDPREQIHLPSIMT